MANNSRISLAASNVLSTAYRALRDTIGEIIHNDPWVRNEEIMFEQADRRLRIAKIEDESAWLVTMGDGKAQDVEASEIEVWLGVFIWLRTGVTPERPTLSE